MYNEVDLFEVKKQLQKVIITISAIMLIFLATAIAFMTRWPVWIGTTFLIVGVCFNIFLLSIWGIPIISYYRFVKDIVTGRTREITGEITKVVEDPIYKDNKLLFYEVWIIEEDEERVLYYDANKGIPKANVGDKIAFRIHENFITQM